MPLWYFFSLFWTSMSTKLWDFSCFLIRNMFCWLVVYFTHLAPHVHFSCFVHALHITTFCTHLCYPCHALVYILFLHPLHVMFTLCFVAFLFLRCFVFCLSFIFSFILYPSCIFFLKEWFSPKETSKGLSHWMSKRVWKWDKLEIIILYKEKSYKIYPPALPKLVGQWIPSGHQFPKTVR